MGERPAVPADLRRRVLVEAGHRCAIHTCQHPDVDVHHIIPWEQCKKHEYDNLIALCPNCHRRADAGEIDRSSLRLYKARVIAAFGLPQPLSPETPNGPLMREQVPHSSWQTATIREQNDTSPLYEVALEFPVFSGTDSDIIDLNAMLRSDALQQLVDTRSLRLAVQEQDAWYDKVSSQLTSSYEISCLTDEIISIRFSVFHYGAGAAHPNHWTKVRNVQLRPLIPLSLGDLFTPKTAFLKTISDYCISHIASEKGEASDWLRQGAGPELKNFSKFNITPEGLFISFDEYQVACYAAGPSHVLIPKSLLREYLSPRCAVTRLWHE